MTEVVPDEVLAKYLPLVEEFKRAVMVDPLTLLPLIEAVFEEENRRRMTPDELKQMRKERATQVRREYEHRRRQDPEYMEKQRIRNREYNARSKAKREAKPKSPALVALTEQRKAERANEKAYHQRLREKAAQERRDAAAAKRKADAAAKREADAAARLESRAATARLESRAATAKAPLRAEERARRAERRKLQKLDPEWLAHNRAVQRRSYEKRKADPAYQAKINTPEFKERARAKDRAKYLRKKERLRAAAEVNTE